MFYLGIDQHARQITTASARVPYQAKLLTILVSGTLRRNVLGAIALGKERSQLPVATTTETNSETEIPRRPQDAGRRTNRKHS